MFIACYTLAIWLLSSEPIQRNGADSELSVDAMRKPIGLFLLAIAVVIALAYGAEEVRELLTLGYRPYFASAWNLTEIVLVASVLLVRYIFCVLVSIAAAMSLTTPALTASRSASHTASFWTALFTPSRSTSLTASPLRIFHYVRSRRISAHCSSGRWRLTPSVVAGACCESIWTIPQNL